MIYIYSNLKFLREKMNLSKNLFAERLGVNTSSVSRWENGISGMNLETAVMIAEKLNISLCELIESNLSSEVQHD